MEVFSDWHAPTNHRTGKKRFKELWESLSGPMRGHLRHYVSIVFSRGQPMTTSNVSIVQSDW